MANIFSFITAFFVENETCTSTEETRPLEPNAKGIYILLIKCNSYHEFIFIWDLITISSSFRNEIWKVLQSKM